MPASRNGREKSRALVVVAKPARVGEVKTRLCPPLTLVQSSSLYECLLKDIVEKMGKSENAELWIAYAPDGEEYFRHRFGATVGLLAQRGNDLGERLHHIFVDLFQMGYREVLIADSDSPTVPLSSIDHAYELLDEGKCDVVLGPSRDGGYYLVGLKSPEAGLFRQIPWSSAAVLKKTLRQASELGLRTELLPLGYDIDVEADLQRLWKDLNNSPRLQGLAPRSHAFISSYFSDSVVGDEAGVSLQPKTKENH